jgi:hypothetical protein
MTLPDHISELVARELAVAKAHASEGRWGSARSAAESALLFDDSNEEARELVREMGVLIAGLLEAVPATVTGASPISDFQAMSVQRVLALAERAAADHDWGGMLYATKNALALDPSNARARALLQIAEERADPTSMERNASLREIPFRREFSASQFERIETGHAARSMDDKWNIQFEAPWLYFHRSWTGLLVYRVRIEATDGGAIVSAAEVFDRGSRTESPTFQARTLDFLVSVLLLGESAEFPVPHDLPDTAPPGAFQHHVAGTGFGEVVVPDDEGASEGCVE